MITQKESIIQPRRQIHLSSFNRSTAHDNTTEVFNAYLEFAFHHTTNDALVYENAIAKSLLTEQKNLFVQMVCRKTEIADRLKLHMSDSAIIHFAQRKQTRSSLVKYLSETESDLFFTMCEALNFACQKENRTTAFYEKLAKTANLASVRTLFDYMLESQRQHLLYIETQRTEST